MGVVRVERNGKMWSGVLALGRLLVLGMQTSLRGQERVSATSA